MATDLIWINGKTLPLSEARIDPEDRGFQFADGVYEVIRLYGGRPFTLEEHLARLERSAAGIQLSCPIARDALRSEITRFLTQTRAGEGMIYLQLTRGVSPRNHVFPKRPASTLLFYTRALDRLPPIEATPPVKLHTVEDDRWRRCWVKSIALLANVLAKNAAVAAGADEAAFVEDGRVSECSASNLFAVIHGTLTTAPVGPKVLPGITRAVLLDCARELGIPARERLIPLDEAKRAEELFITSTTREISPVSHWDDQPASPSRSVTTRLHEALRQRVARATSP
jgi:D-alanine transaminase